MPVRECQVSFNDLRGIRHFTQVHAESVLEAAALGMRALREQRVLDDDAAFDLQVEVVTRTTHVVPIHKLKAWLASNSPNPKEEAMKARLR